MSSQSATKGKTRRIDAQVSSSPVRSAWLGLFLGSFLGSIFFAPASWLAHALTVASNGRAALSDAQGTVWNGSGRFALAAGSGSRDAIALPGRIDWQLRPKFWGAQVRLVAPCCTPEPWQLAIHAAWGGVDLSLLAPLSQWPATILTGLGTPWNTLALEGTLVAQSKHLEVKLREGRVNLTGSFQLDVLQASSRLSTLKPMGSYRLLVSGGELTSIRLSTLEGALVLIGSGQWVGERLRFSGEASATPESEAALGNLLNIIGRRSGARSIMTIG